MEFLKWLFTEKLLPEPEGKNLSENELQEIKGVDDVKNFYEGMSAEALMNPARLEGEDFELYKLRQKQIKFANKNMKDGRIIWHSKQSGTLRG